MAHVLCLTTGLTGILHASFEVVRRLEAWGHHVTYACPLPNLANGRLVAVERLR